MDPITIFIAVLIPMITSTLKSKAAIAKAKSYLPALVVLNGAIQQLIDAINAKAPKKR